MIWMRKKPTAHFLFRLTWWCFTLASTPPWVLTACEPLKNRPKPPKEKVLSSTAIHFQGERGGGMQTFFSDFHLYLGKRSNCCLIFFKGVGSKLTLTRISHSINNHPRFGTLGTNLSFSRRLQRKMKSTQLDWAHGEDYGASACGVFCGDGPLGKSTACGPENSSWANEIFATLVV